MKLLFVALFLAMIYVFLKFKKQEDVIIKGLIKKFGVQTSYIPRQKVNEHLDSIECPKARNEHARALRMLYGLTRELD